MQDDPAPTLTISRPLNTETVPLRPIPRPAWDYYDRISHSIRRDPGRSPASQISDPSQLSTMDYTEEPRKRRRHNLTPSTEVPPPLAPSVEEAYRRKCIQLKTRLNEIEADNDATRLRVQRIERTIQKQRIERAFLLEQLAKRTSTNVEDSEGSPSPPPTVNSTPRPV